MAAYHHVIVERVAWEGVGGEAVGPAYVAFGPPVLDDLVEVDVSCPSAIRARGLRAFSRLPDRHGHADAHRPGVADLLSLMASMCSACATRRPPGFDEDRSFVLLWRSGVGTAIRIAPAESAAPRSHTRSVAASG